MFKTKVIDSCEKNIVGMGDMLPGQIGIFDGQVVMRTLSLSHFEVMLLSDPRPENCWDISTSTNRVELLPEGTVIEITVKRNNIGE